MSSACCGRNYSFFCSETSIAPVQIPRYPFILIAEVNLVPTICDSYGHEIPEALENPDTAVLRRGGPRIHHRQRGQRCQRHRDLLAGRRAVWLPVAVADDPCNPGAARAAG